MSDDAQSEVSQILSEIETGNEAAKERLLQVAYDELRALAGNLMRRERPDHTLQPTALVHEAALRLLHDDVLNRAKSKSYFFGVMATAMRRVLVDHARAHRAQRRGRGYERKPLDIAVDMVERSQNLDLLALEDVLKELEKLNPRQCQVVTLRFFGGFDMPEIAEHLGVSLSTVEKDWRMARAWLQQQLSESSG